MRPSWGEYFLEMAATEDVKNTEAYMVDMKDVLEKHAMWIRGIYGGKKANLRDADLRDADLQGADLQGADLRDADLRDADLRDADLQGADLRGANLRGANLQGANLQGADLQWADLREADLRGANLQGADLQWADLRGADLRGADLQVADLQGANLLGADLREANMDYSSGIPLHCGGTLFVGDDRLFAQMLFHLTRGDWSKCSGGVKEAVEHIRKMAVTDLFCEYRSDVKEIM